MELDPRGLARLALDRLRRVGFDVYVTSSGLSMRGGDLDHDPEPKALSSLTSNLYGAVEQARKASNEFQFLIGRGEQLGYLAKLLDVSSKHLTIEWVDRRLNEPGVPEGQFVIKL